MYALEAVLDEENRQAMFFDYAGQSLWIITSMISKTTESEAPLPQYIELVHPETIQPKESAEEIKKRIVKLFTE